MSGQYDVTATSARKSNTQKFRRPAAANQNPAKRPEESGRRGKGPNKGRGPRDKPAPSGTEDVKGRDLDALGGSRLDTNESTESRMTRSTWSWRHLYRT
jgi:hypothetical protein